MSLCVQSHFAQGKALMSHFDLAQSFKQEGAGCQITTLNVAKIYSLYSCLPLGEKHRLSAINFIKDRGKLSPFGFKW